MGNDIIRELNSYGNEIRTSSVLINNKEVRTSYIQGLQHLIHGGSIYDIIEEMKLCLSVEEDDKAYGFAMALDYVKRYIQNGVEMMRVGEILGVDVASDFYIEVNSILNNKINE